VGRWYLVSWRQPLSLPFACDFWWLALALSAMGCFCKVCPFSALCICHVLVSDTTRMLLM